MSDKQQFTPLRIQWAMREMVKLLPKLKRDECWIPQLIQNIYLFTKTFLVEEIVRRGLVEFEAEVSYKQLGEVMRCDWTTAKWRCEEFRRRYPGIMDQKRGRYSNHFSVKLGTLRPQTEEEKAAEAKAAEEKAQVKERSAFNDICFKSETEDMEHQWSHGVCLRCGNQDSDYKPRQSANAPADPIQSANTNSESANGEIQSANKTRQSANGEVESANRPTPLSNSVFSSVSSVERTSVAPAAYPSSKTAASQDTKSNDNTKSNTRTLRDSVPEPRTGGSEEQDRLPAWTSEAAVATHIWDPKEGVSCSRCRLSRQLAESRIIPCHKRDPRNDAQLLARATASASQFANMTGGMRVP